MFRKDGAATCNQLNPTGCPFFTGRAAELFAGSSCREFLEFADAGRGLGYSFQKRQRRGKGFTPRLTEAVNHAGRNGGGYYPPRPPSSILPPYCTKKHTVNRPPVCRCLPVRSSGGAAFLKRGRTWTLVTMHNGTPSKRVRSATACAGISDNLHKNRRETPAAKLRKQGAGGRFRAASSVCMDDSAQTAC